MYVQEILFYAVDEERTFYVASAHIYLQDYNVLRGALAISRAKSASTNPLRGIAEILRIFI